MGRAGEPDGRAHRPQDAEAGQAELETSTAGVGVHVVHAARSVCAGAVRVVCQGVRSPAENLTGGTWRTWWTD